MPQRRGGVQCRRTRRRTVGNALEERGEVVVCSERVDLITLEEPVDRYDAARCALYPGPTGKATLRRHVTLRANLDTALLTERTVPPTRPTPCPPS